MTPVKAAVSGAPSPATMRLPLIIAALTLAFAGSTAAQSPPTRGEELVGRHCGGCHAVGPDGASREPAAPPLRELHRRYDPELLAEALAEGMLTGHPLMPEFRFPPADVRAVIDYLKSIQTKQPG